ncbi:hypothetical protein V7S43_010845 [Phytophthora oleae]|uniref:PiggyBac transposable element-derived protein domain-containing protein n=1 Tax=Phytophthora oleae TaxID=2107226 RepID=A0ABD3FE15_9STRA
MVFEAFCRCCFETISRPKTSRGKTAMNMQFSVIARYRNFAVLSTMKFWHQHVVWLDANVHRVPAKLLKKMIASGRDIVEPMCVRMKESGED